MGFKTPKMPKLPPAPPVEDLASKAVRDAVQRERQKQLASSGRKSSFLTGALGDSGAVSSTLKKLLGS